MSAAPVPRPAAPFPPEGWRRLVDWLGEHGLDGPVRVVGPLAGGTQNELWRLAVGADQVVLRRHRRPGDERADVATVREGALLGALAGSTVPHPALIGVAPTPGVLDTAFFVMAAVDGVAMADGDPGLAPEVLEGRALGVVDALARLATVDPARAVPGRTWGADALARQPARWRRLVEDHEQVPGYDGLRVGAVEPLVRWLEAAVPAAGPGGVTHGDLHMANVLFAPGGSEVRALVDWELAGVGDPRLDLAWFLVTSPLGGDAGRGALGAGPWTGFPDRDRLVGRYADVADRPPDDLPWFEVLAALKLAAILSGTVARAAVGRADPVVAERLDGIARRLVTTASATAAG